MVTFSVSKPKPKVYEADPSGVCIYCGETDPAGLTREHIMPIGLGGGLILPNASCHKCRKITEGFETACLKKALFPFRFHFGLIRHKKEIPKKIPLHILHANVLDESEVPHVAPEELPDYLPLPLIHLPPGIISNRPPGFPSPFTLQVFGRTQVLKEQLHKQGQVRDVRRLFNMPAFVRMLAKIAHSFAVAEFGLNGFNPNLTDIILENKPELAGFYIGNGSVIEHAIVEKNTLHQVGWAPISWGQQWLAGIRIRLFSGFGPTPIYLVIAGVLSKEQQVRHGLPELKPNSG